MAKLLALTCLYFFLMGCEQNSDCTAQKSEASGSPAQATCPTPTPTSTPEPDHTDVPNEALIFDASVTFNNFERDQEDKVYKALEIIKKVVSSSEFRKRVLNFTYNGKKEFVDNAGFTNLQIYHKLLSGSEILKPDVDHEMDLELELFYTWRSTVGYGVPGTMTIYMNTKFFTPYTPTEVAGNIFHEWLHKVGFDHAQAYSVARDSSVPYALGYLIEELGKKYE